jgi:hypothetical protein
VVNRSVISFQIQEGTAIVVSPLIALMKTKLMPSGVYLQKEVLLMF